MDNLYHPIDIGPLHLDGNLFLAPVAGWSDSAFRSLCADLGASFTCTEMVSADAIVRGNQKTAHLMLRAPNEKAYAVQLFGSDPETMGMAARIILAKTPSADCVDINCGCPVPKIVKNGAGSALMRDPARLGSIVSAVAQAAAAKNRPVTVKIRKGWDDSSGDALWQSSARAAIDAGASAITMHPRTRAQGYEGKADWKALAALKHFSGGIVPIAGSGDLFAAEDARAMILQTGADALMFARGAMGNPFIFKEARAVLTGTSYEMPDDKTRISLGMKELSLLAKDAGEETAVKIMRKRFCAYTRGIKGGASLRSAIVHAQTIADYKKVFSTFF